MFLTVLSLCPYSIGPPSLHRLRVSPLHPSPTWTLYPQDLLRDNLLSASRRESAKLIMFLGYFRAYTSLWKLTLPITAVIRWERLTITLPHLSMQPRSRQCIRSMVLYRSTSPICRVDQQPRWAANLISLKSYPLPGSSV